MIPPVLFFGFANHPIQSLLSLEKESAAIYDSMMPAANQQLIQIHRESFVSIDNISDHLTQFNNRVTLFHYGGHANSENLFLRGRSARSEGIAYQLAQQKNLKLVFLNGCSTYQQVQLLLDLDIPAVIATSATVDDDSATAFAIKFYAAIVNDHTIEEAFEKAAAVRATQIHDKPRIYNRGISKKKNNNHPLAWGLYTNDKKRLKEKLIPILPSTIGKVKNVLENTEMDIDGNAQFGDKKHFPNEQFREKNVLKKSKLNVKGDFHLGDG